MALKPTGLLRLPPHSYLPFPDYHYHLLELENHYLHDIRCKSISSPSPAPCGPWRENSPALFEKSHPILLHVFNLSVLELPGQREETLRGLDVRKAPAPSEEKPTLLAKGCSVVQSGCFLLQPCHLSSCRSLSHASPTWLMRQHRASYTKLTDQRGLGSKTWRALQRGPGTGP